MPRFTGDNIKFTNATVKTLVVPEGKKDKLWFDTEERGFFIRKFKSGEATYGIRYACDGQQRRITRRATSTACASWLIRSPAKLG